MHYRLAEFTEKYVWRENVSPSDVFQVLRYRYLTVRTRRVNSVSDSGEGNLTAENKKNQMPGGVPGGGC